MTVPLQMNDAIDCPIGNADGKEKVGILAAEVYIPQYYVDQAELELHDGVSKGKYTCGLGQQEMAVPALNEDVVSMALTVLNRLLKRTDPMRIGRVEVGSESHFDRAKSIRSFLSRLLPSPGVGGSDHLSACYGGTAALFAAISWMQSALWDGRLAVVITTDIAIYAEGPARPTGGAGAIAMLIGPDAPIHIDISRRPEFFSQDIYDFYKGSPFAEYPLVDGPLSIRAYLDALEGCYQQFDNLQLHTTDCIVVHTPYCKMALKAADKLASLGVYDAKALVLNSLWLSKRIGNIYCGSVFLGLISCLAEGLSTPRSLLVFSYGSGAMGCMFKMQITGDVSAIVELDSLRDRLDSRKHISPPRFTEMLNERESVFAAKSFTPLQQSDERDTWYLSEVDALKRRFYIFNP